MSMLKIKPQVLNEYDASKHRGVLEFLSRNFREFIHFRHAIINFASTRLSSRYRRSTLGFFWSLLNPLFTMIIVSVVFSSLYKLPFSQFGLYIFSGLLPWNLITASVMGGAMSLVENEAYMKKMYIPKLLFPFVSLSVELINFFLSLISLFFLALLLRVGFGWSMLLLPVALLLLFLFLFGLIMLISIVTVFFRDASHILQIGLLGLFYLTPILYPISLLSGRVLDIIKLNPFYYFIELFHLIIYEMVAPTWADWLPCIVLTVFSLVIGVFAFQWKEDEVIYRL